MSHDRRHPLHPFGSPAGDGVSRPTGPETVATWAAATERLDLPPGPSGSSGPALLRGALRSRPVLVGATTTVAAAGLTAALLLSGSSAQADPDGVATGSSPSAPSSVAAATPERCVGEVRTLTGRVVTARHGGVRVPVAVVDVQTVALCHPGDAAAPTAATVPVGGR